jgi:hypothetical protein
MTLQASGVISISNISVELGRSSTAQSSLGESALRTLASVASGAISMSNFYSKSNGFTFNTTISSNTIDYNLKSAAIAAGWNQTDTMFATVTINSGVYVYASSTGAYAFDTGSTFPTGTTLALINNGTIIGKGGNGGTAGYFLLGSGFQSGSAGAAAGPALIARYAISITNNGAINGGGGGGGGGGPAAVS